MTADRALLFGSNSFTGPDYASIDLRMGKRIQLGESANLQFIAEGFNIFNRSNFISPNPGYYRLVSVPGGPNRLEGPVASFGAPSGALSSRVIQFGARMSF